MSPDLLKRLGRDLLSQVATFAMATVIAPGFILIAEHFDGFAGAWRSLLWMGFCVSALRLWTWRP